MVQGDNVGGGGGRAVVGKSNTHSGNSCGVVGDCAKPKKDLQKYTKREREKEAGIVSALGGCRWLSSDTWNSFSFPTNDSTNLLNRGNRSHSPSKTVFGNDVVAGVATSSLQVRHYPDGTHFENRTQTRK